MERHEVSDNYYIHKKQERNEVCRSKCFWCEDRCGSMNVSFANQNSKYHLDSDILLSWQLTVVTSVSVVANDVGSWFARRDHSYRTCLLSFLSVLIFLVNVYKIYYSVSLKVKILICELRQYRVKKSIQNLFEIGYFLT